MDTAWSASASILKEKREEYKLSEEEVEELKRLFHWIYSRTKEMFGKRRAGYLESSFSSSEFAIENLPDKLFDETVKRLREIVEKYTQKIH